MIQKTKLIKAGTAAIVLLFSLATGFQLVAMKTYTLVDKHQVMEVRSVKTQVKDILEAADVELGPYDRLSVPLEAHLKNHDVVIIERGISINVQDGDKLYTVVTQSDSQVKDVLQQEKITLGTFDQISPAQGASLRDGSQITVKRITKEIQVETNEIPYPVVFKVSSKLKPGESKVIKTGTPGVITKTVEQTFENGSMIEELMVSQEEVSKPVEEIIEIAEDKLLVTSRGKPYRVLGVYVMKATAYDLSYESTGKVPGDRGYGLTRMGTQARPGVVAVDPTVIPLGSRLYIESSDGFKDYGFAVAEDTGSAIKGNKIDLFIDDSSLARRFGNRYVRVYILDEPVEEAEYVGYGR